MSLEVNLNPWQGECQLGSHEETVYLSCVYKGKTQTEWTLVTICREHFEKAIANAYDIALIFKLDPIIQHEVENGHLYALRFLN